MVTRSKAQAGVVLVLVLTLLGLLAYSFILKSNKEESNKNILLSDYMHDYASSMLTSLLRSSTGNPLAGCQTVKEVLAKAYYAPTNGKCCGVSEYSCKEYAQRIVEDKINKLIANAKKNYIYYFEFGKKFSSAPLLFAYPSQNSFIKTCKCEKIIVEQKLIDVIKETTAYPYAKIYVVRMDDVPENLASNVFTSDLARNSVSISTSTTHQSLSQTQSQSSTYSSNFNVVSLSSSLTSCTSDSDCNANEKCCITNGCSYFPKFTGKCMNEELYNVLASARSLDRGWDGRLFRTELDPGKYKVYLYYADSCSNPNNVFDYDVKVDFKVHPCHSVGNVAKIIIYAGENCERLPLNKETIEFYLSKLVEAAKNNKFRYDRGWCDTDMYCIYSIFDSDIVHLKFENYDTHPLPGCYVIILWNYLKPPPNVNGNIIQYVRTYSSGLRGGCLKCANGYDCYDYITLTAHSPCADNRDDAQYVRELRSLRGSYTSD